MKKAWFGTWVALSALASLMACGGDGDDDPGASSSGGASSGGSSGADTTSSSSSSGGSSSSSGVTSSSSSSSGETSSSGGSTSSSSGDLADASDDASDASDAAADAAPDAGPIGERIHFLGRYDDTDPNAPRFQWSGSGVVTTFQGTGISVRFQGAAQIHVMIDGQVQPKVVTTAAEASYTLATDLPLGEHKVELYRRDEAQYGTLQFRGFQVTGGDLVPTIYPFAHKLEFIGDSITCGYGIEGNGDPECTGNASNTNEYYAYSAVASRLLDAAHSSVSWSGKGMYRNYPGIAGPTMPGLYDLEIPIAAAPWDFARYTPDAVVVYLGNNDYTGGDDPGQPFTDTYVAFLAHVREKNPAAHIFAVQTNGYPNASPRVEDAVEARNAAGDANVHFVMLGFYNSAAYGWGCDYHYSQAGHEEYGDELAAAIRQEMGW